jgi:acyl-CoA thioesterase YciA
MNSPTPPPPPHNIPLNAAVDRVGRTSRAVRIEDAATRDRGKTAIKVTEGLFTFVALDSNNRPRPVDTIA